MGAIPKSLENNIKKLDIESDRADTIIKETAESRSIRISQDMQDCTEHLMKDEIYENE